MSYVQIYNCKIKLGEFYCSLKIIVSWISMLTTQLLQVVRSTVCGRHSESQSDRGLLMAALWWTTFWPSSLACLHCVIFFNKIPTWFYRLDKQPCLYFPVYSLLNFLEDEQKLQRKQTLSTWGCGSWFTQFACISSLIKVNISFWTHWCPKSKYISGSFYGTIIP